MNTQYKDKFEDLINNKIFYIFNDYELIEFLYYSNNIKNDENNKKELKEYLNNLIYKLRQLKNIYKENRNNIPKDEIGKITSDYDYRYPILVIINRNIDLFEIIINYLN